MHIRVACIAILALAACSGDSTSPGVSGNLALHRFAWEQRNIVSYDYELTHGNEWFPASTSVVSVRNGVVTKVVDKATGQEVPLSEHSQRLTIAFLFDEADRVRQEAVNEPGLNYQIRFHPVMDYVQFLSADHEGWADDAYSYSAANLVRR